LFYYHLTLILYRRKSQVSRMECLDLQGVLNFLMSWVECANLNIMFELC